MDSLGINRAVWTALRFGKPVSMDYLQEVTGEAPRPIFRYLNTLMEHGFIAIANARQAGSGETVLDFRLARKTGPRAPYTDKFGKLIDPNEISRMEYADRAQKLKPANLAAIIWIKARGMGEYTISDMLAAVNKPYSEKKIWTANNNLFLAGYVSRVRRGVYKAEPLPPELAVALEELKRRAKVREISDLTGIYKMVGKVLKSRQVGFLMDLLRAENYSVWVARNMSNGSRSVYRIEEPKSRKSASNGGGQNDN